MNKKNYEPPIVSVITLTQENELCGSPEKGQTESIGYEDLFS